MSESDDFDFFELRDTAEVVALKERGQFREALALLETKLGYIEFEEEELVPALMLKAELLDCLGRPIDALAEYHRVVILTDEQEKPQIQKRAFQQAISMLNRYDLNLWVASVRLEAQSFSLKLDRYGAEYVGECASDDEGWTPEKTPRKRPRRLSSEDEEDSDDEPISGPVKRKL